MKTGLYSDMKKLLSVTFPILVAQLSTMGINFINTTMAGHAGADDLAGVSVGTGIFFPFEGAAIGLLMAGTPIIAQLIGKNEKSSIPFVVRTGIYIALALSMLFFAGYFFFADEVVSSMGLTAEVEYIAKNYIFAMVVAVVFISLIIPLRSLTDVAGSTATSMKLFLSALPINAVLNYFLIYGHGGLPRLGGIGAGVSAAITYFFVLLMFLYVIHSDERFMGKEIFASGKSRFCDWKEYMSVGIPSGLSVFMEMGLFGAIIIFMARFGTETLAAYQVADNFANMAYMVPLSCSMALTILVARAAGAKDHALARRYAKAGILMSVGFSAAEVLLTAIFREQIGLVYTDDAAVIAIASQFLIFASGFQFFDSISAPVQGILRGYKDAKVPFILLLAAYWGACFPVALFLDHQLDMAAVSYWIGLDVGVAASAVFMAIRLFTLESGFMENTAAVSLRGRLSLEPAYDNGVYRVKAEVLTGIKIIWQYCREIGNNLFVPQEKIVEIHGHVLTGIQRKLIGHAARAYVP